MDTNSLRKSVFASGKNLMIFAIVASALVAITFELTKNRIVANERDTLLDSLYVLIPRAIHDNDMSADQIQLDIPELNYKGKPVNIYRARSNNQPVAAIFAVTAPDGYSGPIKLLIAIDASDSVLGVRVVSHKETPGLGDDIETDKSDWIKSFNQKSLINPAEKFWRVKKDGGVFDQFTGATITPRAVVKATLKTLQYYTYNKQTVYATLEGGKHAE